MKIKTIWHDLTDPQATLEMAYPEEGLPELNPRELTLPYEIQPIKLLVNDVRVRRAQFSLHLTDNMTLLDEGSIDPIVLSNDLLQIYNREFSPSKVRGLHASENLQLHSRIKVGEVVTLTGTIIELDEKRGTSRLTLKSEARGEDGRLLLSHQGTEAFVHDPGAIAGGGRGKSSNGDRIEVLDSSHSPTKDYWEVNAGTDKGQLLPSVEGSVSFEEAAVYSRIDEFVSNIHNSLSEARNQGLATPVVQGEHQVSLKSRFLTELFGESWIQEGTIATKFLRPLPVFEDFVMSGQIIDCISVDNDILEIKLNLWIASDDLRPYSVSQARLSYRP